MSKELIKLFTQIAQIDSPSGEEQQVAEFIIKYLKDLDLNPEIDDFGMIYCRIGEDENPSLFCAHMDTVEPGRGIKVIEEDGYLKSKGETILGGDNKVSLAAILFSLKDLLNSGVKLNIELLFSVREETDSGIQQFDTSILQSKTGFVFDGGRTDLGWCVTRASTIEDFVITLIGKGAHASKPEEGINALEMLLELKNHVSVGRLDEHTTFNIGLINGGNATNTIPSEIKLQGDLRSFDTALFDQHKKLINTAVNAISKQFNTQSKVEWIPYSKGYVIDEKSAEFEKVVIMYNDLGIQVHPIKTTGGSDANFLNNNGITTFCLGDGVEDPHTTEERISVENFEKLQRIVETLMQKY